jgi:hypothetical protein
MSFRESVSVKIVSEGYVFDSFMNGSRRLRVLFPSDVVAPLLEVFLLGLLNFDSELIESATVLLL